MIYRQVGFLSYFHLRIDDLTLCVMIWLRHDLRRAHDFSLRSINNAEGKSCDDRSNSFFMIWLRHDLTASRHDLRRAHDFSLRSINNAEGKSCDERSNSFFMIWLRHDLTASRHDLRRAHDFSLRSINNAEGKSCGNAAIHYRDINTTFSICGVRENKSTGVISFTE